MRIEDIVTKINSKGNRFEEIRKKVLEVISEINQNRDSKFPIEMIPRLPDYQINIKDINVYFTLNADEIYQKAALSGDYKIAIVDLIHSKII